MEWGSTTLAFSGLGAAALATSLVKLKQRLELSKAKHKSLTGHARMSRRVASLLPFYEYDEARFFRSDDPPETIAAQRQAGFTRLSAHFKEHFAKTLEATAAVAGGVSDLQFTDAYRVPFQYSRIVRQHLPLGSFLQSSGGVTVTDLDGNTSYDLTGSYGVNLFGTDFYKDLHGARPSTGFASLVWCSGSYHPVVADNVRRLKEISGLDEVSFHMSGTEAVMQAVRLARYHTRRSHLVRFCGAYHGWWGDVQPGVGNPLPARDTYTLKDMSEDALRVLRTRNDIACVLVNPLQALHPNGGAPADTSLVDSGRHAGFDKAAYADWLKRLRAVCTERNIVLIFDEVFVGFRLALRRRPGILRRPGRPRDLWQDGRRRLSDRRGLRPQGPDEAVPRRPAGRHLLCARHVQLASRGDGRDERVPAASGNAASPGALSQPRRAVGRPGAAAQQAPAATKRCRCRWRTCPRSGPSATRGRRATTGCCNTTFAPKAWR